MSATAAAIVDNPWVAQSVWIDGITPEITGVATYHLRFARREIHENYRFLPGQFNMLYLPGAGEIAISLSAGAERNGTWDHTIRVAGNVTRTLARLEKGGKLGLRGPYGSCWPLDECVGADIVLVTGGIGLAPLRPVVHALLAQPDRYRSATLLYGARSAETMLYEREHQEWSRSGLRVETTVDRATLGWRGNVGVVPLLLDRLQPFDPSRIALFVCGPEVMMRYSIRSALRRGARPDRIWISMERNMQCAVGLCGHCQFGPAFICKDGPILRYDRVAPLLDVKGL